MKRKRSGPSEVDYAFAQATAADAAQKARTLQYSLEVANNTIEALSRRLGDCEKELAESEKTCEVAAARIVKLQKVVRGMCLMFSEVPV